MTFRIVLALVNSFQIFLDYFYCPPFWTRDHWRKTFFSATLPGFVINKMFQLGDYKRDFLLGDGHVTSQHGVILLPFCDYCFVSVVEHIALLSKYFVISFVHENELHTHALWDVTRTISPEIMYGIFDKDLNQESTYCVVTRAKIKSVGSEVIDDSKKIDIFDKIVKVESVRMIKLTVLRKFHVNYNPDDVFHYNRIDFGVKVGGFLKHQLT